MDYIEQLMAKFYMEQELSLMARPHEIQKDISFFTGFYHRSIKRGDHAAADMANALIDDLKKELEDVNRSIKDNSRQVLPSQSCGDKRVFILQR